jgi:N-dimethylarginine dimethylaminohydrolase
VVLLGWAGDRSTRAGAEQVAGWMSEKEWTAHIIPLAPQFVHMDAVVVMLEKGLALVCVDGLPEYGMKILEREEMEIIPVSYADCVKLGGNLVSLGNRRILSMSHNINVNRELESRGFEVHAIDYDMYALGGGGVHCSCHELRREPDPPD